ncbi:MAG TPA: hypothetical protein VF592_12500 [Sphingomonas sp.]|jgi:hypothetical protein|uniref:hypothetical protein n=1 Tax=Sphingomonas sp. TaxID=28214 RepID=UPI002EDBAE6F
MKGLAARKVTLLMTAGALTSLAAYTTFQQRTRTIEGTWVDLFEGSRFIEGEGLSSICNPNFTDAPSLAYNPEQNSSEGKLIKANRNSGVFVSRDGRWPVAAYSVRFDGHHQIIGLGFGHAGLSPSEYVVHRMLSIGPIPSPICNIRPG